MSDRQWRDIEVDGDRGRVVRDQRVNEVFGIVAGQQ